MLLVLTPSCNTPQDWICLRYSVQEVPPSGSAKIKVKARLNLHGLVSLESATQVLEEEVEEAQAPDAADAKEKDGDTPMRVRRRPLRSTITPSCNQTWDSMLKLPTT